MATQTQRRRAIHALVFTAVAAFAALRGLGAEPPGITPRVTVTSQSGQFIVYGVDASFPKVSRVIRPVGDNPLVELRPDLAAVTCERVRRAVNLRLGFRDLPGTKVHVRLRPRRKTEGPLSIELTPFSSGWQMTLDTPDSVEWKRLVRALVEVTLLDHAGAMGKAVRAPTVPLWLSEGMDALLEAEFGKDLVVESQTALHHADRRGNPLAPSIAVLAGAELMTFGELSLAGDAELAEESAYKRFRASSAVLTSLLLESDEGRAFLRDFLGRAPNYLNWQLAFLSAGNRRFNSLLEVERWWAVAGDEVVSREPSTQWPRDRVVRELWNAATESADVRDTTNSPAVRRTYRLSEVIDLWPYGEQRNVLEQKAAQLRVLAAHTPPDLFGIVTDYFQALASYVDSRDNTGKKPDGRMTYEGRAKISASVAKRRLADLERRLAAAAPPPAVASK
jgi:hypothetical protein